MLFRSRYTGEQICADPSPWHRLACRYDERTDRGRVLLLDAAHTAQSVEKLMDYAGRRYGSFSVLFAALSDKDIAGMLKAMAVGKGLEQLYAVDLYDPRAFVACEVLERWQGLSAKPATLVPEAAISTIPECDDPLVVCGSFRLLSAFMRARGLRP